MQNNNQYGQIIWDYMLMHHELQPMDAVIAFGTSDTRVAERAAELFLEGYGEYLICSGDSGVKYGKQTLLPKPEAEVFADIAVAMDVPKDKILIENKSTNTGENVLFSKALMQDHGLDCKSFVLVHKPYMERRTYTTFKKQWPGPDCVVTSPDVSYEAYAHHPALEESWLDLMVGDLQKIQEYPAKGFQIPQEIPEDVMVAYEKLISLGYTKYLI